MTTYLQDPSEKLRYSFDFAPGLDDGESVSAHTVTISTGMTVTASSRNGAVVTALLEGGVDGQTYTLTWRATTDLGQVFERSDRIRVTQL